MISSLLVLNLLLVAAATVWLTYYLRKKFRFLAKTVNCSTSEIAATAWTVRTLNGHLDARLILPPPGPWTLDAPAIATLCNFIRKERPARVVELGSGLSTVVLAALLREFGGSLVSIDHDEAYATVTRQYLAANSFEDFVDLRIAPLQPISGDRDHVWYDRRMLHDLSDIDLLVVDGPPKSVSPRARRHALPQLLASFSSTAHVFLDDADRADERAIINEWTQAYGTSRVEVLGYPKAHMLMAIASPQDERVRC